MFLSYIFLMFNSTSIFYIKRYLPKLGKKKRRGNKVIRKGRNLEDERGKKEKRQKSNEEGK